MMDCTVQLPHLLTGMTTELKRAEMNTGLFQATPYGIHAHCVFCIPWFLQHAWNSGANTHL